MKREQDGIAYAHLMLVSPVLLEPVVQSAEKIKTIASGHSRRFFMIAHTICSCATHSPSVFRDFLHSGCTRLENSYKIPFAACQKLYHILIILVQY